MPNNSFDQDESRGSRMLRLLDERMNEVSGARADLHISDCQPLDRESCYALINWAPGLPAPTTVEVVDFIGRTFDGKVRPVPETAKAFVDHQAILMMLAKYQPTRPINDVATMHTVVAGARYLDVEMRDTWDVAATPEGTKYLRRVTDDDVSKMVAERRSRMAVAGMAQLTVAKALTGGVSAADAGDIVRCYFQGSVYSDCEVKSLQAGNRLSVKVPGVGTVTVAREAILEIQAISKSKANEIKKKNNEYYKKAFGDPKYAGDLTNELIDEGVDSAPPSNFAQPMSKK